MHGRRKYFVLLIFLFSLSSLAFSLPGDSSSPSGASGVSSCQLCEDLSTYSSSTMVVLPDEQNSQVGVGFSYGAQRQPVRYAPIIVRVTPQSQGTSETGIPAPPTFVKIYTDVNGLATFDFSSYKSSNSNTCVNFDFIYCYSVRGCGFANCLSALGITPISGVVGQRIPSSVDSISLAPGAVAPVSGQTQFPIKVTSQVGSYSYCPPPPGLNGGTMPAFCLPLILIFALLGGALYVGGRNPFSMFDFNAPRMGKHIRYSGTGRAVSIDPVAIGKGIAKGATLLTASGRKRIVEGTLNPQTGKLEGGEKQAVSNQMNKIHMLLPTQKGKELRQKAAEDRKKANEDRMGAARKMEPGGGGLLNRMGNILGDAGRVSLQAPIVQIAKGVAQDFSKAFSGKEGFLGLLQGAGKFLGGLIAGTSIGIIFIELYNEIRGARAAWLSYNSTKEAGDVLKKGVTVCEGGFCKQSVVSTDKQGNPLRGSDGNFVVTAKWTLNGKEIQPADVPKSIRSKINPNYRAELAGLLIRVNTTFSYIGPVELGQAKEAQQERIRILLGYKDPKKAVQDLSSSLAKALASLESQEKTLKEQKPNEKDPQKLREINEKLKVLEMHISNIKEAQKDIATTSKDGNFNRVCNNLVAMNISGALETAFGKAPAEKIFDPIQGAALNYSLSTRSVIGSNTQVVLQGLSAVLQLKEIPKEYESIKDLIVALKQAYAPLKDEEIKNGQTAAQRNEKVLEILSKLNETQKKALTDIVGVPMLQSVLQSASTISSTNKFVSDLSQRLSLFSQTQLEEMGLKNFAQLVKDKNYDKILEFVSEPNKKYLIEQLTGTEFLAMGVAGKLKAAVIDTPQVVPQSIKKEYEGFAASITKSIEKGDYKEVCEALLELQKAASTDVKKGQLYNYVQQMVSGTSGLEITELLPSYKALTSRLEKYEEIAIKSGIKKEEYLEALKKGPEAAFALLSEKGVFKDESSKAAITTLIDKLKSEKEELLSRKISLDYIVSSAQEATVKVDVIKDIQTKFAKAQTAVYDQRLENSLIKKLDMAVDIADREGYGTGVKDALKIAVRDKKYDDVVTIIEKIHLSDKVDSDIPDLVTKVNDENKKLETFKSEAQKFASELSQIPEDKRGKGLDKVIDALLTGEPDKVHEAFYSSKFKSDLNEQFANALSLNKTKELIERAQDILIKSGGYTAENGVMYDFKSAIKSGNLDLAIRLLTTEQNSSFACDLSKRSPVIAQFVGDSISNRLLENQIVSANMTGDILQEMQTKFEKNGREMASYDSSYREISEKYAQGEGSVAVAVKERDYDSLGKIIGKLSDSTPEGKQALSLEAARLHVSPEELKKDLLEAVSLVSAIDRIDRSDERMSHVAFAQGVSSFSSYVAQNGLVDITKRINDSPYLQNPVTFATFLGNLSNAVDSVDRDRWKFIAQYKKWSFDPNSDILKLNVPKSLAENTNRENMFIPREIAYYRDAAAYYEGESAHIKEHKKGVSEDIVDEQTREPVKKTLENIETKLSTESDPSRASELLIYARSLFQSPGEPGEKSLYLRSYDKYQKAPDDQKQEIAQEFLKEQRFEEVKKLAGSKTPLSAEQKVSAPAEQIYGRDQYDDLYSYRMPGQNLTWDPVLKRYI